MPTCSENLKKKEFDEKMRKKDETETGVVSVSGCETRTGAIESPFVLPSGLSSDCHPLAVAGRHASRCMCLLR